MPSGENNRKLSDADLAEVERMYTTQNLDGTWNGSTVIAQRFGVHPNAILHRLAQLGITRRDSKTSHAGGKQCKPRTNLPTGQAPRCRCGCGQQTAWLRAENRWRVYIVGHQSQAPPASAVRELYINQRRTIVQVAHELGVTKPTIVRVMRRNGIQARSASEAHVGVQAGSQNPAWKGGVTPARQRLYKTAEWKALVSEVFARDSYKCQRCDAPKTQGRRLHAHHIATFADAPDQRFVMKNLVTLCNECHHWVHSKANTDRLYLAP